MLVAIEGMDGCGKSVVAKQLANYLNYEYRDFPNKTFFGMNSKEYKALCRKVYTLEDEYAKAWFFGFRNIVATKNIHNGVVLDRHLLSNYFWNGTERSEKVFKNLIDLLGRTDLTIILYAGVEERMRRISLRDPNDWDLKDPEKKVFGYDKMIDFAKKYNLPFVIINTEKYDLNTTINICKSIIDRTKDLGFEQRCQFCKRINDNVCKFGKEPYSLGINKGKELK